MLTSTFHDSYIISHHRFTSTHTHTAMSEALHMHTGQLACTCGQIGSFYKKILVLVSILH